MKRAFASIAAAALILAVSVSAGAKPEAPKVHAPAPKPTPKLSKWEQHVQQTLHDAAPGDAYFGRMKIGLFGHQ